ncbi:MAG: AMP-binding protein [Candidatus Eiseniibacteriota bacterium]|nr:MAG: AMP-binding protein [Candidatus Eisenbacteria bacterium]
MIADILREAVQAHGARTALRIFSEGSFSSLSYGELDRRVDLLAASVIARGMERLERVCLVSENRPEWVLTYLGILRAGCTVVPLDSLSKPQDMRYLVRRSGARLLFTSGRFLNDLEELRQGEGPGVEIVALEGAEGFPGLKDLLSEGETLLKRGAPCERRVDEEDDAVLIFTSGTTGASKGVMLSHRNICSNVESVTRAIHLDENVRALSVLPLHHTFEVTAGLLAPMSKGACVTYARSLRSKELLADLLACRATLFVCVPLLYEKMAASMRRALSQAPFHRRTFAGLLLKLRALLKKVPGLDLGSGLLKPLRSKAGLGDLTLAISGAAPLSPTVQEFFGVLGIPILEGYGLTEASPVVSVNRVGALRCGSVGHPIPGVEVKIANPDAQGVGEVLVKGENVMKGYFDSPEETAKVLQEGFLRTGDLGRMDEDGYLYICGRLKSVIVTPAGKKIFPEEVEAVLGSSPLISEVVVVGKKGDSSGREEVHAIVYPDFEQLQLYAEANEIRLTGEETQNIIRSEIRKLCSRLPDYKRVRSLSIRNEEFPKTSTRKIKRQSLQDEALSVEQ